MKRTTIEDVARLAGVGKVTVSYVLNGRSTQARISPQTQEKVLAAVQELNYKPNAVARMLATKRTNAIAVVFQHGDYFSTWSNFTSQVMRGVSSAAVSLGYDLMLHTKVVTPEDEADVLCDGRVDGALVLRDDGDPIFSGLQDHKLPCVQFFSRSEGVRAAYVDSDNYAGGRMATRHLIDLGHRKIGMVRGSLRSTSSNDRFNGYRDALEGNGIGVGPERVISIPSPNSDLEPFRMLMRAIDRPTALFVWSDEVAFACMEVIWELGLSIPDEVSIVGFDSLEECNSRIPPLTSVRQPVFEMASEATRLLISLITGQVPDRSQVLYPLSLDIRSSTCPFVAPLVPGGQG